MLSVKPVELRACLAAFDVPNDSVPVVFGRSGLCGWVASRDGVRYAIAMVGAAGNVEAAVVMGALTEAVRPKAAVLVGMAAGVRGEVKLGDIVVGEAVLAYEFARATADGIVYAAKPYSVPDRRIRDAELLPFRLANWTRNVVARAQGSPMVAEWPLDEVESLEDWVPSVKRGVVLAGSKLIEDASLPDLARIVNGRARVAEMEGAGFAAACDEVAVPWLVVRGVADYGEPERRKHWQFPATFAAAHYLRSANTIGLLHFG